MPSRRTVADSDAAVIERSLKGDRRVVVAGGLLVARDGDPPLGAACVGDGVGRRDGVVTLVHREQSDLPEVGGVGGVEDDQTGVPVAEVDCRLAVLGVVLDRHVVAVPVEAAGADGAGPGVPVRRPPVDQLQEPMSRSNLKTYIPAVPSLSMSLQAKT